MKEIGVKHIAIETLKKIEADDAALLAHRNQPQRTLQVTLEQLRTL